MYSLGLKECLYREAVNVEYSRNLPDLASIVKKRKEEKKSLQEQNIDKSRKLQQLKNEFNERVSYYSQL